MWLNAYGATTHHVCFETDEAKIADATPKSPEHREVVTEDGNVYYLNENLTSGSAYYWRVDAVMNDKMTYKGDIWSFQTETT